jgi:hypothetical protein
MTRPSSSTRRVHVMTGHPLVAVCRTLRIGRSTACCTSNERMRFYARREDAQVLEEIRTITRRRDSYGYRQVTAPVNP